MIIGALNVARNDYDEHTLDATLEQQQRLTGHKLKDAFVDLSYRERKEVLGTATQSPKTCSGKLTNYRNTKLKEAVTKRAAIEPKFGHSKAGNRLSLNFYKGIKGDNINVMLPAAAMNFKRMINIWKNYLLALFSESSRSL